MITTSSGLQTGASPTLRAASSGTNQAPTVAYCLQGNTVDRRAAQNGAGILEGISYTLNTIDRHAVVAMAQKHIIADGSARDIFWNEEVVSTSRIRKIAIGELAKELKIGERILYCDEMVEEIARRLGR